MEDNLELRIRCVNQAFGPDIKLPAWLYAELHAENGCHNCIADEKNRQCPYYKPVKIYVVDVVDNDQKD